MNALSCAHFALVWAHWMSKIKCCQIISGYSKIWWIIRANMITAKKTSGNAHEHHRSKFALSCAQSDKRAQSSSNERNRAQMSANERKYLRSLTLSNFLGSWVQRAQMSANERKNLRSFAFIVALRCSLSVHLPRYFITSIFFIWVYTFSFD